MKHPDKYKSMLSRDLPLLGILTMIFVFNIPALFCLDTILVDDLEKYYQIMHHQYDWIGILKRSLLGPLIQYPANYITVISPTLARTLILFIWMVPASVIFYLICRKIFGFTRIQSVAVSVLPAIMPQQILIPAFVDGSYTAAGLLFTFLFIYFSIKYIKEPNRDNRNFWIAIISLFISLSLTELMVFALIPIWILFFLVFPSSRKLYKFGLSSFLFFLLRIGQILFYNQQANNPQPFDSNEVFRRIPIMLSYVVPFWDALKWFYIVLSVLLLLIILIIIFIPGINRRAYDDLILNAKAETAPFVFSILWIVCTIFPFVFMSTWIGVRHFYFAGFGFSLLFFSTINLLIRFFYSEHSRFYSPISAVILFGIIGFTGIGRILNLESVYGYMNNQHHLIRGELLKKNLPPESQVVVIGTDFNRAGGFWRRSSGYFQYALNRTDISGILPFEYSMYNPFDTISGRTYQYRMNGLNIRKPIFLFRIINDRTIKQMVYALQWNEKQGTSAEWVLYKFDPVFGTGHPWIRGTGINQYHLTLDSITRYGIRNRDILWGDSTGRKPGNLFHP